MRLVACGTRGWHDEEIVEAIIGSHMDKAYDSAEDFFLIHGYARTGADAVIDRVGKKLGLKPGKTMLRVPANWKKYQQEAAEIRNQKLIDERPDIVLAFYASGKCHTTDDLVARARDAGIPTRVISVSLPLRQGE